MPPDTRDLHAMHPDYSSPAARLQLDSTRSEVSSYNEAVVLVSSLDVLSRLDGAASDWVNGAERSLSDANRSVVVSTSFVYATGVLVPAARV